MNRRKLRRYLLPTLALLAALAFWEAVVRINHIEPVILPAPSLVLTTLVQGLAGLVPLVAGHADDHAPGADRRHYRRHAAGAGVRQVPGDRGGVLSLRRHHAGDAGGVDRAAAAGLSELRRRGSGVFVPGGVLPDPLQHRARPVLGRSQSARSVPAVPRLARPAVAVAAPALRPALFPRRLADRRRPRADRRDRRGDRRRLGGPGRGPRLPHH